MGYNSKKALIHIGTEKTGSTSLQSFLANGRTQLRDFGILFPRSAGPVNHTSLVAASEDDGLVDNIKAHILASRHKTETQLRQRLRTELEREMTSGPPWHTLMISSELIQSRLHTKTEVKRLLSYFSDFVDEIQILVFLRRQDQMAVSRFSTAIRAGHSRFDDVLGDLAAHQFLKVPEGREISDMKHYYDYAELIDRFAGIVEDSNIFVHLYQLDGDRVSPVEILCSLLGLNFDVVQESVPKQNMPMSAEAQFVISRLNRQFPANLPTGERNRAFKELRKRVEADFTGRPRTVKREDAQAFLARFAASNEIVRERFFPERSSLFDTDFSMYPETVSYEEFETQLAPVVARYSKEMKLLLNRTPRRNPVLDYLRRIFEIN